MPKIIKSKPKVALKIKDKSLVTKFTRSENVSSLIIKRHKTTKSKNDTYLAEVIEELPAGIIHKAETGIGATFMELDSPRNSIIVEPIRVTASNKAYSTSRRRGEVVLYVGSQTPNHPNKITKDQISAYLNNKQIKHKKIVVVADSLKKVIDAAGPSVYTDFFLMIDEADSFQMDSTFRMSMEVCIDVYKKFMPHKRALVSATTIGFSDPLLNNEHHYNFKYDIESKRKISVLMVPDKTILSVSLDTIISKIKKHPNDKIVVAFNSVKLCYSLLIELVNQGVIDKNDVSILCSKNNEDKVKPYYKELNSVTLPTKLCFMTSAYFSGFDIEEKYHLISVSSVDKYYYTLSEKRIKQIAGRCRVGLQSETIIHDAKNAHTLKEPDYNKAGLVRVAQTQVDAFKCMHNHYKKHKILYENFDNVSSLIMKSLEGGNISYIRRDSDSGDFKISYLTIDAVVEGNRTRNNEYDEIIKLTEVLRKLGHRVSSKLITSKTNVSVEEPGSLQKEEMAKATIEYLREGPSIDSVLHKLERGKIQPVEKLILQFYTRYYSIIESDSLIGALETASIKKDSRKLQNLELAANFCSLPADDSLKNAIYSYFKIGEFYTTEEIYINFSQALTKASIVHNYIGTKRSVEIINLFFETKRNTRRGGYSIISENPYRFNLINNSSKTSVLKPTLKIEIEDLI